MTPSKSHVEDGTEKGLSRSSVGMEGPVGRDQDNHRYEEMWEINPPHAVHGHAP